MRDCGWLVDGEDGEVCLCAGGAVESWLDACEPDDIDALDLVEVINERLYGRFQHPCVEPEGTLPDDLIRQAEQVLKGLVVRSYAATTFSPTGAFDVVSVIDWVEEHTKEWLRDPEVTKRLEQLRSEATS